MKRHPAVAGRFYSNNRRELEANLASMILEPLKKKQVIGVIVPHAGYIFSGACAGKVFGQVEIPDSVVILGVNHSGRGLSFAVDANESWVTPLGEVEVDDELRSVLLSESQLFKVDPGVAKQEHSLEIQVPFIQYLNPNARILPITISSRNVDHLITAGKDLARVIQKFPETLIVASTDMSHFISAREAEEQDGLAISQIMKKDPEGLLNTVINNNISMCGVSPTAIMLSAANQLGIQKIEQVDYTHSGMVTGDFQEVVAYLGMVVY
jgi:MEMO1 family protein